MTDKPLRADWRAILDCLAARHSCRAFDGTPIDRETLADIVRDGTEAPSSCNQQNWHFIIVDDRDMLARAQEISGGNLHFADCAALIYLTFQKGWTHGNFSIVQSVAGACYHMMLSAHLRGFQCIWNAGIGEHAPIRAMLGLPETFELQGALAIGRALPDAPAMKAPRRPFAEVHSFNGFARPGRAIYPARPAEAYPFFAIHNHDNPFAEWDPAKWSWEQLADFRGLSVWAKSPLAGVYVSRRQGEATDAELSLLPGPPGETVVEIMPWGGTTTAALRRKLPEAAVLRVAELSERNHLFIRERLRQEGLPLDATRFDLIEAGRLPYGDDAVDAVVALQVLEHMPGPEAMLDEIARVLKPGGAALVSIRNRASAYGALWRDTESRAQVPNQGPFQPLDAGAVRGWLEDRFGIEDEIGIGAEATGDAAVCRGDGLLSSRLYAALCRKP